MILLPDDPAPAAVNIRPVSHSMVLAPLYGGPETRITRMGDRWAMDVTMPPMRYVDAMAWVARLSRARGDVVRMKVPQPGLVLRGKSGTVLVNGADQAGTSLDVDGGTPQYPVREGQWVSLVTGERSYLYMIGADVRFDASGEATLSLDPMLRAPPADNDPLEIEEPVIEGFLEAGQEWSVDAARHVGLQFTIRERA